MLLLTTAAHSTLSRYLHPNLGRLVVPRCPRVADTARAGIPWAADNAAFGGFDVEDFERLLGLIAGQPGCLFVACPDVVGDAAATEARYREWAPRLHALGLPVALVLQDGVTSHDVPWAELAAVFVGGTDEFKGSPAVGQLVDEAKARGKWAHMGRVNSARRITYAGSIGCDSFDGSSYSQWRDVYLRDGLARAAAGRQLPLF